MRVEDAVLLWKNDRKEGAFLNVLIAVAATARRRFPEKTTSDREAFERFLQSSMTVRLSVEYRGECQPVEHIFYKWFRCELVHEGSLPIDIQFISDADKDVLSVRAGGAPEYILKISESWFRHLIDSVKKAPEYTMKPPA